MDDKDRERFVRWQGISREQLGKTSDLVLGLATALFAFNASWLLDGKFSCGPSRWLAFGALVLLGSAIGCAIWCAVNRLQDFRATAQIAKGRNSAPQTELDKLRDDVGTLGARTWGLFYGELLLFALGALSTGGATLVQAWRP